MRALSWLRSSFTRTDISYIAISAVAGYFAFRDGSLWTIILSLLLPFGLGRTSKRVAAVLVACAYFAGVWFPVVQGARVFYGHDTYLCGAFTWLCAIAASVVPFGCLWSRKAVWRPLLIGLAVTVHASLPIGLGSPVVSAGVLFPGAMWLGVVGLVVLCSLLGWRHRQAHAMLGLTFVVAAVANSQYRPALPVDGWVAVNTHSGGTGFTNNPMQQWFALRSMLSTAEASPARVILFPETIAYWSDSLGTFFERDLEMLRASHKTVLFGAEVDASDRRMHNNVVLARGAENASYVQRIPIPISMWGRDVAAHPFGTGILTVGGHRVAVLLCYEQLLTVPALQSFADNPDVLIGASNLYWAQRTTIPDAEKLCLASWGRLFRVPVLRAVNT